MKVILIYTTLCLISTEVVFKFPTMLDEEEKEEVWYQQKLYLNHNFTITSESFPPVWYQQKLYLNEEV